MAKTNRRKRHRLLGLLAAAAVGLVVVLVLAIVIVVVRRPDSPPTATPPGAAPTGPSGVPTIQRPRPQDSFAFIVSPRLARIVNRRVPLLAAREAVPGGYGPHCFCRSSGTLLPFSRAHMS